MQINFSPEDIKLEVLDCLKNGRSLSMIRLGDGEMIIAKNDKSKINIFCEKQIGRGIIDSELDKAQKSLINSVLNANILGLPTDAHCKKNILWKDALCYYDDIKNNNKNWVDKKYCSIDSHIDMLNSGDLFEIFKEVKKIVIVSPRNIVNQLQTKFSNIVDVEWYSIPAEQKYEIIKNDKVNIFEELEKISLNLKSKSRNKELLIFGAGPFGKHVGSDFASVGGVALDLGSVFDLFVGKLTRGKGKGSLAKIDKFLL